MKKRVLSVVLLMAMAVSLLSGCGTSKYEVELPTELVENAEIFVNPVEGISDDFIKGMDISSILSLEDSGVKFYNEAGEEQDIFKTLADAGINYIRVRVWNDPYDADGNGYGGGNCDAKVAGEIGKRAAKYGMKLLVDFHYSDFWADPAKQMAPKAWADMDFFAKQEAIVEYTKESLKTIQDAGADIGMVQIGNEINHGMAGTKNYDHVLALLKSAAEAVKSVSEDILVCVHYTEIDNPDDIMKKAANLQKAEVDYDVFGVSYYPYWHGTLENLTYVLKSVKETYGVEVCVVETSYAYTTEDGDCSGNTIGEGDMLDQYPATVQGQANFVRDVIAATVDGGGIGVFYWEGAWIPVGNEYESNMELWTKYGSGWASKYATSYDPDDAGKYYGGSAVDNQAFFDFEGKPLASLNVWKYVNHGAKADKVEVMSVIDPSLVVTLGDPLVLPETVEALYNDATVTDPAKVTWDATQAAAIDTNVAGKYMVTGTIENGMTVTANVKVENTNYLQNHSFEDKDASMWEVTYIKNSDGTDVQTKAGDAVTGTNAFHWYHTSAQEFKVEQTITAVKTGDFTALANIQGGDVGDDAVVYLYVIVDGVEYKSQAVTLDGWVNWKVPTITDIPVKEGSQVTIGMYVKCAAAGWGTMDDFEFYSQR